MSIVQNEIQEFTPDIIKETELRSAYRYFRVFRTKDVIFDYPAVLSIRLQADKAPIERGSIRPEFRHTSNGSGRSIDSAHGPGPFKEQIETPQLQPHESRKIEIRTRSIKYIPRILNPASLTLTVLNSKDQHRGYKTLYIDLKSLEEAKNEIRNKIVFWAVILTLLVTLASFLKDCVFPLTRDHNTVISEAPSGKQSPDLAPAGKSASSAIPNRNGSEKVVVRKGELAIPNTKLRQPIEK